jgi:hypothetical protein
MEALNKMITATIDRCLLSGFFGGSKHSCSWMILWFFVGLIMIIFAICVVFSYVLKLFRC